LIFELKNPAWYAMTSIQEDIAIRHGNACRYNPKISPFAAIAEPDDFPDLETLVGAGAAVALISIEGSEMKIPVGWQQVTRFPITQMICDTPTIDGLASPGAMLSVKDDQDMLALAEATDPGPFMINTRLMGDYVGVRDSAGTLVAMAGERIRLPGWTEISGVCTADSARGKGYATALVAQLMTGIFDRGEKSFLHVRKGSVSEKTATGVYEKLGFRSYQDIVVQVLLREA
jgi:GNAT superfamily N-acetyltransferase